MVGILKNHFITRHLNNGVYAWTLTTYLGHFITKAESIAAKRDLSWTILGIEFYGNTPMTYYPHTGEKHVVIRLSEKAAGNRGQATYQLAHEAMHLISPGGPENRALSFEEGLCTRFQDAVAWEYEKYSSPAKDPYAGPKADVDQLLGLNPSAIMDIRALEPRLWLVTPEIIQRAVPKVTNVLAERLCSKFPT